MPRWRRAWVAHALKDRAEFTREAVFALREGHGKKVEHEMWRDGFECVGGKSFVLIGRANGNVCGVRLKIECVGGHPVSISFILPLQCRD